MFYSLFDIVGLDIVYHHHIVSGIAWHLSGKYDLMVMVYMLPDPLHPDNDPKDRGLHFFRQCNNVP